MPRPSLNPNRINASISLNREIYELYKVSNIGQVITPSELIDAVLALSIGVESPDALYHEAWLKAYSEVKNIVTNQIKDRLSQNNNNDYVDLPYYDLILQYMDYIAVTEKIILPINRYNTRIKKIMESELNIGKFSPDDKTNNLYKFISQKLKEKYPYLND